MMPKEDGVSFLKSFRISNTNTPVLMLTAMKEIDSKINSFGTSLIWSDKFKFNKT